jgi:Helix-hairpin-helix domain
MNDMCLLRPSILFYSILLHADWPQWLKDLDQELKAKGVEVAPKSGAKRKAEDSGAGAKKGPKRLKKKGKKTSSSSDEESEFSSSEEESSSEESDSSDEDSDSDFSEEAYKPRKTASRGGAAPAKKAAAVVEEAIELISSDEEDSEEEDKKKKKKPAAAPAAAAKKPAAAAAKKKAGDDEEGGAEKKKRAPAKPRAPAAPKAGKPFTVPKTAKGLDWAQKIWDNATEEERASATMERNSVIFDWMEGVVKQLETQRATEEGDAAMKTGFRIISYRKAIDAIQQYGRPIVSGRQAQCLAGVGPATAALIDEIIATGKIASVGEIEEDPTAALINKLDTLPFFDKTTAGKFLEALATAGNGTGKKGAPANAGEIPACFSACMALPAASRPDL